MAGSIQVELDDFMGKEFVTFRKTKNYSEVQYSTKYNFINLINKHYTRQQDNILLQVSSLTLSFNYSLIKLMSLRESIRQDLVSSLTLTTSMSLSSSWTIYRVNFLTSYVYMNRILSEQRQ